MIRILGLTFSFFITSLAVAQSTARDSIRRLTEADYNNMLMQLHITSMRPGANGGNPKAPNAANYDETKANPYPDPPDPLQLNNGQPVQSAKTWWKKRRPEIVEDFDRLVLGRVPRNTPRVNWQLINTKQDWEGSVPVTVKQLVGHADNSRDTSIHVDIQLTLVTPTAIKKPVPVIMELSFVFPPGYTPPPAPANAGPSWQSQVLANGWGYATLIPVSIQPDNGAGLTQGIIGLTNKGNRRKPDDWGALRAWAWGASRAVDYLETDAAVDAKYIGLEGHSRFGKAALVAMAYDPRISIGFISSSGEGGAKLHRRNAGEIVENLTGSGEYHWMAGNFLQYGGPLHWNDIPVDAHELIALCAPRPVFISSGNVGDGWVDARGMFMAAAAAGPVYRLLGKKDLGSSSFPPVDSGLVSGDIAWRQHNAGHTPAPNWPYFINFTKRYFPTYTLPITNTAQIPGLKDRYRDYFPIGVAVSPWALRSDEAKLILHQFNSLTPENAMKMGPVHPAENRYNFKDADSIAAFARRNHFKLRGHTLCWHNQVPAWLFTDANGDTVSKTVLLERLKEHIFTMVERYKDVVYAWDVVNEVISDKPGEYFRNSPWYRICGEDFVAKAFEYAHAADPKALLFYNDYNEINPTKREKTIRMIKDLQKKGIPINGIGLQAHWAINEPSEQQLDSTLRDFSALGLTLQITEMDVSVYPKEHTARERRPEDADTAFSSARENKQADVYDYAFKLFRKYRSVISGVTFWNVSDRHSWLDDFPVTNRKDHPLLFDASLAPKKAFWKVANF